MSEIASLILSLCMIFLSYIVDMVPDSALLKPGPSNRIDETMGSI